MPAAPPDHPDRAAAAPAAPLRVALLGCGRIAQGVHLPILAAMDRVEVAVLADPSAAARDAAGARAPGAATLADWREAATREDVDAVVVCLPTHLHAEPAAVALAAGKHVYLEKPVAIDAESAKRVVEAADAAGGSVAMAGFNYRFHRVFREMRRRLLNDDAGDVVAVRSVFAVPPRALPTWKSDRRTGGGALLDQFSHHADLLRFLLDGVTDARPLSVTAGVRGVRTDRDTAVVQTTLGGGVLVSSTLSLCSAEQDVIEVLGTRGRLVADRIAGQVYFDVAGGGYSRVDRVDKLFGHLFRAAKLGRFVVKPGGETGHRAALAAFVETVRNGDLAPVTMADGARSLAWVLAAEESADTGGAVAPDLTAVGLSPEPAPVVSEAQQPKAADLPPLTFADDRPLATVVLAASQVDESIRHVVAHVRRQTVAARLEFIAVAPSETEAADLVRLPDGESETLGEVRTVATNRPITNVDAEAARGILMANGPVTCVIEDHAFPAPDWVEKLIETYRGDEPVGAAGSVVRNANPKSSLSRMNLLIAYGTWLEPLAAGETGLSNHNVSYRTDAVSVYGDSLAGRISRAGSIMADLQSRGFALKVVRAARVHHTNPSRLASSVKLRFDGGRLFGATKATEGRWSRPKRLAFFALSPAIAGLRLGGLKPKLPGNGLLGLPALGLGLALDAIGQGWGFAFGPGGSPRRLEAFELGRLRHLQKRDRRDLTGRQLRFDAAAAGGLR